MNEKSNIFINKDFNLWLRQKVEFHLNFLKKKIKYLFDDHRKLKLSKLQRKENFIFK